MNANMVGNLVLIGVCLGCSFLGIYTVDTMREDAKETTRREIHRYLWERDKENLKKARAGDLLVQDGKIYVYGGRDSYKREVNHYMQEVASDHDGHLVNGYSSGSWGWTAESCDDCHEGEKPR